MNEITGGKKILAIDDDLNLLSFLRRVLKIYFPETEYISANSAEQGLKLAEEQKPNVILLDILMPDVDGFDICKQLKSRSATCDIPVVFISGVENTQANRLKAIEAGADAFLLKPVDKLELMLQVKTMFKVNAANIKNRNEKQYLEAQVELHLKKLRAELEARKETERQLKRKEYELQELNNTKDKFFSIIGHDLKGPFGSMMGISEMIYDSCKSKEYDNLLNMATMLKNTTANSYELLNDLLEWSSAESGRKKANFKKMKLCYVLHATVDLLSVEAARKNINLQLNCVNEIEISADEDMLGTVLRNLISNAVKYSNSGDEILVSVTQRDEDVLIAVKDEGLGIKPEMQDKLFKIGEYSTTLGTLKEKGTGLGLILCKEFIEMHGGKIGFESEFGKGSTFYFNLPLKK